MSSTIDFFRQVYFFKDLGLTELEEISLCCHTSQYPKGTVVFTENARAERFFIVETGRVEVWKDFYSANPDLLGEHGPGHLFGEMGLIDDLPRSATVVAAEDTRLFYVLRDDFLRLTEQYSAVGRAIIRSLSAMIRTSNQSFVNDLQRRNLQLERANKELNIAQQELLRRERLSNLGKFSSLILHDIRNPISIMKGYTELIHLHADNPEKVRKYCSVLLNETQRMSGITNEFLDYSRGEIRLDLSVVELSVLFEWQEQNIGKSFLDSGKKLIVKNEVDRPVLLDVQRMQRVWLNLAENARKAIDEGGSLCIHAWNDSEKLYIQFADSGVGMDPETVQSVFEPFFSKSAKGGTGLGMVIVKSVIEAHGGEITVESVEKKGTTITICLPLIA